MLEYASINYKVHAQILHASITKFCTPPWPRPPSPSKLRHWELCMGSIDVSSAGHPSMVLVHRAVDVNRSSCCRIYPNHDQGRQGLSSPRGLHAREVVGVDPTALFLFVRGPN
jgi:hypothetical protein